ncbi:hypothetical protein BU23DRAFT_569486 [Bimuria novae-zelandiae CBS 107.79]|uniref:Uncharacterized protein n=1 Tax=Bimuria novae-zelandiae CBS 107.79 TaxID=1447943 RepID=A0A6A5V6U6_9PLEO|nr:hypothetical protein BU23DRAFT_569486 [Bimuria novae-zelandiae CBS 107.79]
MPPTRNLGRSWIQTESRIAKTRSPGGPKSSGLSLQAWKTVNHRVTLHQVFTQCAKFTKKDLDYLVSGIDYENPTPIMDGLSRIARKTAKRVIFPRISWIMMRNALRGREVALRTMHQATRALWIRDNVGGKTVAVEMLELFTSLSHKAESRRLEKTPHGGAGYTRQSKIFFRSSAEVFMTNGRIDLDLIVTYVLPMGGNRLPISPVEGHN